MPKIKIFLLIIFVVFGFFIFGKAKAGTSDNVSGWAWSENIGWISFNCNNPELPTPRCLNNYGVNINSSTGVFSGDAWSEHIGWISFRRSETGAPPTDDPCPDGSCIAKLDLSTNKVSGWARALTDGGGWDGWIKLRGTAQDGSPYGVNWNQMIAQMEGWAWSDQVIGWLSFNCKNTAGACDTSNYKVIYGILDVTSPAVSIIADPVSVTTTWQKTDATATVSCTDTGTGCDTTSYKLKTYTSSGTCSTTYSDYTLSSPQTISSHLWVCGAAKDFSGNAGFSPNRVEFKVDKTEPNSQIQSPASGTWYTNDFNLDTLDEDLDSGLDPAQCQYKIIPYEDTNGDGIADTERTSSGWLARTCNAPPNSPVTTITVGLTDYCKYQAKNACYVYILSKDIAGNLHSPAEEKGSIKYYHIDWTNPVPGKLYITATEGDEIYPINVSEGTEYTFKSHVTDNLKIAACDLYIDNIDQGTMTLSPSGCSTDCTASKNFTFTGSGTYHNNYSRCRDAAGNIKSGTSVDIAVRVNHAPVITSGPSYTTSPCTSPTTQPGCNVNFTISATDADNDTLTYNWDFGDGGTSTEQNPVHHYSTANTYTVTVTVSDGRGGTASGNLGITVSNPTLSVDLCAGLDASLACSDSPTFSSPANDVDLKATVSGTMSGTINYYFDCFNDGTWDLIVLNQTTESYTAKDLCDYPSAGTYTPKVFIERGTGSAQATITMIKVIEDRAPSLSEPSVTPTTGGSSTNFVYKIKYTDLDGDSPNFVRVHIKKGGLEISGSPSTMSYVSGTYTGGAIYSFSKSGLVGGFDYTYFFEARDNKGVNATPTSEIDAPDVNNPPTAAISCDASGCQPGGQCGTDWIAYNRNCIYKILNQSTDPEGNIIKSVWSIFYQDGTPWQDPYLTCSGICDLTLPPLPASNSYYVKLKVEDTGGLSSSTTHSFYVRQDAIADFECSLNGEDWQSCQGFKVSEDVLVYFRSLNGAFLSRPSEGASSITSFSWTFKNGTPASSTLQNPSVNFKKVDTNSGLVTLTITDNIDRTDTQSYKLLITVPLPEWREVPPL